MIKPVFGFFIWMAGLGLGMGGAMGAEPVEKPVVGLVFSPEEQAFEIKLARLMQTKGDAEMLKVLQAEHARNPRSWTKAWLAQISLYPKTFELKPIVAENVAWEWLREAMTEGCVIAHSLYGSGLVDGKIHVQGKDPAADKVEGARLIKLASEAGSYNAMITLAHCYFFGVGLPQDRVKALEWARRAAAMSYPLALTVIASYYEGGVYVVPADKAFAARLYYENALFSDVLRPKSLQRLAKEGVKDAEKFQRLIALEFMRQGYRFTNPEVKTIVSWLETNYGKDPEVLVALGEARMNRRYHTYDLKKARSEFEQAAALGSDEGAYHVARVKLLGLGVSKDEKAALEEIRRLAEKGLPKAAGTLGWAYYWGAFERIGLAKNPELARQYCVSAAKGGDWFGILNVGHCYKHGIGGPTSNEIAYFYYGVAAKLGSRDGREELERLRPFLKD